MLLKLFFTSGAVAFAAYGAVRWAEDRGLANRAGAIRKIQDIDVVKIRDGFVEFLRNAANVRD